MACVAREKSEETVGFCAKTRCDTAEKIRQAVANIRDVVLHTVRFYTSSNLQKNKKSHLHSGERGICDTEKG
jgi:hypothetical protein